MPRLTSILTAAVFAIGAASPALACSFGKSASHDMKTMAEVEAPEKFEEAMTTFDPADKPAFEKAVEASDEVMTEETQSE